MSEKQESAEAIELESDLEAGEKLLTAVERIVRSPDQIVALVRELQRGGDEDVRKVAPRIISHFSKRSAVAGAATALPALVPGLGTLAFLATGPLADMLLLLKWETEMCLALAAAYGYDIREPRERQLAFLLAAVKTAEVSGARSLAWDTAEVTGEAIWNYGPRRVGKFLVTVLGILAAASLGRVGFRAIPLVGMAVGASMNKWLTTRVGKQAQRELETRRQLAR